MSQPPVLIQKLLQKFHKDMQEFLASRSGRSGPGRFPSDSIPIVAREIISTKNVDLRTLLRMCSYLVDIDQILGFDYLMGKSPVVTYMKEPSSSDFRRKILGELQTNLSAPSTPKDLDCTISLFSWVRHHKFRDKYTHVIKTKLPQRIRYGTDDEEDMLRHKMKPEKALTYIQKAVSEELKDLEKPQGR